MSGSTTDPILTAGETREAQQSGASYGVSTGNAINNAGSAIASTAKSGASTVSGWWDHVSATYQREGMWAALKDAFSGVWDGLLGFVGMTGDPEKDKNGLNWRSLGGAGLFAIGGWMVGGMLPGYLGMAAGLGLAAVGAIMGAQWGNGFNDASKNPKRVYTPATGPVVHYTGPVQQQSVGYVQESRAGDAAFNQAAERIASNPLPYNGEMYEQYRADLRTPNRDVQCGSLNGGQLACVVYSPASGTDFIPASQDVLPRNPTYSFVDGGLPRTLRR